MLFSDYLDQNSPTTQPTPTLTVHLNDKIVFYIVTN